MWGRLGRGSISKNSLSGQVAPAAGLEPDDDVCDLQVPLFLQVRQDAGAEEDLALADAVQIAIELQGFDLDGRAGHLLRATTEPSEQRQEPEVSSRDAVSQLRPLCWAALPPAPGTVGLKRMPGGAARFQQSRVTSQTCGGTMGT